MLNIIAIPISSKFPLKLVGSSPEISPDLEKEIEYLWKTEQERRGKTLVNGSIMSASMASKEGIFGFISEYRHFIAQQARPELFDILNVRPVAVSGLLICADGIVFGRRAGLMTQDSGLWELVPSGGVDTGNITGTKEIKCGPQILLELREEVGIKSELVEKVMPFCFVEDEKSHVIDIGVSLETQLSQDEILKVYELSAKKEYDELRIVRLSDINTFVAREADRIVRVSIKLIQFYQGIENN